MSSPSTAIQPDQETDTNVMVGPRKRRPTRRVTDNADPLARKRAKRVPKTTVEDVSEPGPPPPTQPRNRRRVLEASDGSDDDRSSDVLELEVNVVDEEGNTSSILEEDDDTELARLRKEWDSPIYIFFKPLPSIEYVDTRKAHVFKCGARQCHFQNRFVRRFLDKSDAKSTSNLRRHAKVCWGVEAVAAADSTRDVNAARDILANHKKIDGSITAMFRRIGKGTVTYSHRQHTRAEARTEFVRWICENNRPFQIVNDRGFCCLMKTGRPEYYIPSAETLSLDVKNVFVRVRKRISTMLKEYDGKLSFATDAWTSPNHKAYVAITVHLENRGEPLSMLLDLVDVPMSHTGANLAIAFAEVLQTFGIKEKILSVTADNASNNDTMISELGEIMDEFPGAANQTRCFAHTINISAKAILRQFDIPKQRDGEELDEAARALADLAQGLDLEERMEQETRETADGDEDDQPLEAWDDFRGGLTREEEAQLDVSVQPVRSMLVKLRKLAFALKNSTTKLLPAWYNTLTSLGLPHRMMPRDVTTRWNSTFDMLEFAIQYRPAIDSMTATRQLGLRKHELVPTEWVVATELRDILKIFKDATLFFSRGTPNLATVIPAMDHIDKVLATSSTDSSHQFSPAIRAALPVGKNAMNKYYNKTDHSEVYRMAMVLHPRHKLEYFKRHNWEEAWIDTARDIVRKEFDRQYASMDEPDGTQSSSNKTLASSTSANIFDDLPDLAPTSSDSQDELDRYLMADVENVKDGLMWWYERSKAFPRLSRMARDYLSIPATTVAVEREFSRGRLVLPHVRSRLSVQSTRALMCTGSWSLLGLVKDGDISGALGEEVVGEEPDLPVGWDSIS